jgi:hypothetical protein
VSSGVTERRLLNYGINRTMMPNVFNWSDLIPDEHWQAYREALEAIESRQLKYALGGGYAFSAYAHRWRDTKDLDIYILPHNHEAVIAAMESAGYRDYFSQSPYDRSWSYRGFRDGLIVDALWGMPSHLAWVEESWLTSGPTMGVRGMSLRLLPIEEFLRLKLYVFQRTRCDWPDLLNMLLIQGASLDWQRLLTMLDDDVPLMAAVVTTFAWVCPTQAQGLPEWIWPRLGLHRPPSPESGADCLRASRLCEHDWLGPRNGNT